VNPAIANQQALGTALLNQSQGIGPNPAQAALNSSTGQNVANQAALMAGQRGASANPALMAKLIAEQGARTQQQAVGQSATLQAEQQLAAQRELGGLSAQQIQQAQAAQNAGTQAGLSQEGELQAANTAGNNAAVSSQNNINDVNARISAANANQGGMLGGLINGVGAAIPGIAGLFKNGAATGAADAGAIQAASTGSLSSGMDLGAALGGASTAAPAAEAGGDLLGVGSLTDALGVAASNVAPLAVDLAPLGLSSGGKVSGKPKVKGNDPRNDTTPAMLSPGEIVLPNSVTQSPDAAKKAAEFVKHLKGKNKKEETGYSKVASAKKSLKERVEHLEKLCSGGMV
jgi:hypothetical protein